MLQHSNSHDFGTSNCLSQPLFLAWRVCSFVSVFVVWIMNLVENDDGGKHFIYLTNISFMMLMLYLGVATIITSICVIVLKQHRRDRLHIVEQFQWVLFNYNAGIAPLITIIFWTLLSKGDDYGYRNLFVHMFNVFFFTLDNVFSATPMRHSHVVIPTICGIIYLIANAIYCVVEDETIYGITDWNNDFWVALIVAASSVLLGIPFMFALQYGINYFSTFERNEDAEDEDKLASEHHIRSFEANVVKGTDRD